MPSDLFRPLIVLIASISAVLLARWLAREVARKQAAEERKRSGAGPAAPPPPMPREVSPAQLPPLMTPPAVVPERRRRRLNPADARTGIVVATILGPCRAHQSADDDRA